MFVCIMNGLKNSSLCLVLLGSLLWVSCSENSPNTTLEENISDIKVDLDTILDGRVTKNILKSIPSPVEINTYILHAEAKYHKDYLSDVDHADDYITTYKKSLNLGVYSADMAYINLHKKYRDAFSYFNVVRKLTSDLNISTLFDLKKLKYYAENMHDNDSLVFVLAKDFDFMVNYLNEHNKSNTAVLMISGGFIESLNIARNVYLKEKNQELRTKILEQKMVITDILLVLEPFKTDDSFNELYQMIAELETKYQKVQLNKNQGETSYHEQDGVLVIDDSSSSEVSCDEQDLDEILNQINKIRSFIIK